MIRYIENRKVKQAKRKLNEGPGAGYSVKCSNFENVNVKNYRINKVVNEGYDTKTYDIDCSISATVSIDANSYYYGGTVNKVPVNIYNIRVEVSSNDEYDGVSEEDIESEIKNTEGAEYILGGGYSHSTFDGDLFDDSRYGNCYSGYCVESMSMMVKDKDIINYIDRLVTGENRVEEYEVLDETNDVVDAFDNQKEAIGYAQRNDFYTVRRVVWDVDQHGDYVDIVDYEIVWRRYGT